jgi:dUTP pyrophosphatase
MGKGHREGERRDAATRKPVLAFPRSGNAVELRVQRLREDAVLPSRAYDGDAGLDLAACGHHRLAPGARAVVPTGLAVAIPAGYAGFVQPRSGLAAKHGITIVNTPGLVDSGYRGEVNVVLLNTDPVEPFVIEPGMRIAQLVVIPVAAPDPVEVGELPASERAERGFGSSA